MVQKEKISNKTIIIGGGFYGLSIAIYLYEELGVRDILVIEKESNMMTRASYVNQARVHNGYHYPRSVLTGYRSAVNFPRFIDEYKSAIVNDFDKYYGVASKLSKINARQFYRFAEKIGADISDAPKDIQKLFNDKLVEKIFKVKEYAFNSHKLRDELERRIDHMPGIVIKSSELVEKIQHNSDTLSVLTNKGHYEADFVLNCTYASINKIHRASNLPLVKLKHEITEMCLVRLPKGLEKFSITMMDGPFFSIMPFPSKSLNTLSHVRYTPHESWVDDESTPALRQDPHKYLKSLNVRSNYRQMYNDVIRFIPALRDMEYVESIVEVKTVLVKSEGDDSRPILFKANHGFKNYICIMGGKLDNIYDVFEELEKVYGN